MTTTSSRRSPFRPWWILVTVVLKNPERRYLHMRRHGLVDKLFVPLGEAPGVHAREERDPEHADRFLTALTHFAEAIDSLEARRT